MASQGHLHSSTYLHMAARPLCPALFPAMVSFFFTKLSHYGRNLSPPTLGSKLGNPKILPLSDLPRSCLLASLFTI